MLQIGEQKDACSWAVRKTPKLHGLQRVRKADQHLAHICSQARMIQVRLAQCYTAEDIPGGGGSPPSRALARAADCRDTGSGAAVGTHRARRAARASAARAWQLELVQLLFSGAL